MDCNPVRVLGPWKSLKAWLLRVSSHSFTRIFLTRWIKTPGFPALQAGLFGHRSHQGSLNKWSGGYSSPALIVDTFHQGLPQVAQLKESAYDTGDPVWFLVGKTSANLIVIFLPGELRAIVKSLMGYSPGAGKESNMTEWLSLLPLHSSNLSNFPKGKLWLF